MKPTLSKSRNGRARSRVTSGPPLGQSATTHYISCWSMHHLSKGGFEVIALMRGKVLPLQTDAAAPCGVRRFGTRTCEGLGAFIYRMTLVDSNRGCFRQVSSELKNVPRSTLLARTRCCPSYYSFAVSSQCQGMPVRATEVIITSTFKLAAIKTPRFRLYVGAPLN